MIDNLPDFIFVKDSQGRYVDMSDRRQLIGKTDFDYFPREMAQSFHDDEQRIIKQDIKISDKEEKSRILFGRFRVTPQIS